MILAPAQLWLKASSYITAWPEAAPSETKQAYQRSSVFQQSYSHDSPSVDYSICEDRPLLVQSPAKVPTANTPELGTMFPTHDS